MPPLYVVLPYCWEVELQVLPVFALLPLVYELFPYVCVE